VLEELNRDKVSNLDKAIQNALEFTAEVLSRLKKSNAVGEAA
jgi:hypothetical protein